MQSLDSGCSLVESPETVGYSLVPLTCVGVSWHFCIVNQGALSFYTYDIEFLALHTFECSLVQFGVHNNGSYVQSYSCAC